MVAMKTSEFGSKRSLLHIEALEIKLFICALSLHTFPKLVRLADFLGTLLLVYSYAKVLVSVRN